MRIISDSPGRPRLFLLGLAATITLTACGSSGASVQATDVQEGLEDELVVVTAGGTFGDGFRKAYLLPFESATGVDVVQVDDNSTPAARIEAQLAANQVEWDVLHGYNPSLQADMYEQGLLGELDYSLLGEAADLIPEENKHPWGIDDMYIGYAITYNTTDFDPGPSGASDFFDLETFPGPRMMNNWGEHEVNLMLALMADGVAREDLIPLDFDRAFAKLDTIKDELVYFVSGNDSISAVVDGRVAMCYCADGRMASALDLNPDVTLAWGDGIGLVLDMAIVKDAPHPAAAHEFFKQRILNNAWQATFTGLTGYAGTVPGDLDLLSESEQENSLANPDNRSAIHFLSQEDYAWLQENRAEIDERWQEWISR